VAFALGLAALAVAFAARSLGFEEVFLEDGTVAFVFGDAFYHARRAYYSFTHFPAYLAFDACINHPDGSVVPHPPLLDWALGGTARLFGDTRAVFERVAAWSPVVFGALGVWPVSALGSALGRPGVGLGAAFLYACLPITVLYSRVGNPDHHAAAGLLGAALLAGTVQALGSSKPRRLAGLFAGLVLGRLALLGTWTGSLLYLAPLEVALAATGACLPRRGLLAGQAASCAVTAALLAPYLAASPTPNGGPLSATELSWLHALLYAASALGCGAVLALELHRPARSAAGRIGRAAAVAGAVLAALALVPGVLDGLRSALSFLAREDAYTGLVLEQLPLFWDQGETRLAAGTRRMGLYALALPFAPLAFLLFVEGEKRTAQRLLLFAWCLLFGFLALDQFRYAHDFAAAGCVAFALGLAAFVRRLEGWGAPRALARGAAVALGAALLWPAWSGHFAPAVATTWQHVRGALPRHDRALLTLGGTQLRFAETVKTWTPPVEGCGAEPGRPAYGVLAHPAIGHVLHYVAERATPADPFGPYIGRENYARVLSFLTTGSEAEAVALTRELETPWVLTAEEGARGDAAAVASRLQHDDGSARSGRAHLAHFRLLVEGPRGGVPIALAAGAGTGRSLPYKLFERVESATLDVPAPPGEAVEALLAVKTSAGRRFRFRATGRAGPDGRARLLVPYSTEQAGPTHALGPWRVRSPLGEWRVRVPERAVREGTLLRVDAE
jgi:dolichyl-diphosphooligosaccharide--protein glycosyltransferase